MNGYLLASLSQILQYRSVARLTSQIVPFERIDGVVVELFRTIGIAYVSIAIVSQSDVPLVKGGQHVPAGIELGVAQ